jgi:hypothetical protein
MIRLLMNTLCLSGFNLINSRIDAFRILKNKTIAHGINLTSYFVFSILQYIFTEKPTFSWCKFPYVHLFVYLVAAFCNRQITFDIPLNLRRGLKWDHVSQDRPPKAFWDRFEVRIFGYNGRLPVLVYTLLWVISLISLVLIQKYSTT